MDVVNIGRSKRFLKERPIRVSLFDRPRLVCDLICLEAGQTEKRRGLTTSDSLYLVVEGKARLHSGLQIEELQEQDAALIPPGVDHSIENIGDGQLTVMALVTPKPSRAGEVRMPVEGQPRYERPRGEEAPSGPEAAPRAPAYRDQRPQRPYTPRPPRGGERPSRDERPPRPYTPRAPGGGERPYRDTRPPRPAGRGAEPRVPRPPGRAPRGERPAGAAEGPVWFPRPKAPWRP
ncbi:MAG TPA: cupin domain-containing protein, partial [Dehalococcoidia bacterium]|nr:cupin domain-containing protein [Dehalococcoidia bacterium]